MQGTRLEDTLSHRKSFGLMLLDKYSISSSVKGSIAIQYKHTQLRNIKPGTKSDLSTYLFKPSTTEKQFRKKTYIMESK